MSGRDDPPLVIAGRLVATPMGYVVSDRNDPSLVTRVSEMFCLLYLGFPEVGQRAEHGPGGFSPRSQKQHHPQPSSPVSGYVERWHAHIATAGRPP
jgi:hypothetical protein